LNIVPVNLLNIAQKVHNKTLTESKIDNHTKAIKHTSGAD